MSGVLAAMTLIALASVLVRVRRGGGAEASPPAPRLPYVCERGYARARSAADTAAIDGMRSNPNPVSLEDAAFVKTCGALREESRQRVKRSGPTTGLTNG